MTLAHSNSLHGMMAQKFFETAKLEAVRESPKEGQSCTSAPKTFLLQKKYFGTFKKDS